MGGCYSCKSTDYNTPSTAHMASENKPIKRTTPYFRSQLPANTNLNNNASNSTFGFKRKTPITQQSSSEGTTGNLVQKYDKIQLKNDANSTASRFGYRPANVNKRVLTDANSNISPNDNNANNNDVKTSQKNISMSKSTGEINHAHKSVDNQSLSHQKRTEILKKQFLGTDFNASQKALQAHKNSCPNAKSGLQKPKENKTTGGSKIPMQGSGLPRPGVVKTDSNNGAKKAGENFIAISYKVPSRLTSMNHHMKPKLQRVSIPKSEDQKTDARNVPQTSPDDTVDEPSIENDVSKLSNRDSGLGCSLKSSIETDKKIEKDDELSQSNTTLNSVTSPSELSSDNSPKKSSKSSKDENDSGDFLIDDEIADQPSLVMLHEPIKKDLMTQSHIETNEPKKVPENISKDDSFANEEHGHLRVRRSLSLKNGDKRSPTHPVTLAVIAAHRQSLCSTMSSCSSINSDDLMMDFEGDRLLELEDEELAAKNAKNRVARVNSRSSTLDELTQLVDSQKEPSTVRQRLASIRSRSRTCSTPEMTQSMTEMPSRHRSLSSPLKPPRPLRILADNETAQGAVKLDPSSYRSLCQDVTNVKTMLFRLKRLLYDADTLNPFDSNNWKNSVYQKVANFESPNMLSTCQEEVEQTNIVDKLSQENADLRRQVVFLEQQMVDKDRTIKLLQQQMTKYTNGLPKEDPSEKCNAATQTTKQMRSTTSMDGISPTTISNIERKETSIDTDSSNTNTGSEIQKPANDNQASSTILTNNASLQKRSKSACNIPRAPSTGSVSNISSSKSSFTSINSQPETSSDPKNCENRLRSGAFSNSKPTSHSNSLLDTSNSKNNKVLTKQSKVNEADNEVKPSTFGRNSFARNSGRFLSLFKLKKNPSSNA